MYIGAHCHGRTFHAHRTSPSTWLLPQGYRKVVLQCVVASAMGAGLGMVAERDGQEAAEALQACMHAASARREGANLPVGVASYSGRCVGRT